MLFGNVLGISLRTVVVLAILGAAILVALILIARPLLFASLQPELAEARGVPLGLVSTLFMVIVAVTTAEAIQIVGVLLVFALMVAPAATALRLTRGVSAGHHRLDRDRRRHRLDQPVARLRDRLADEFLDHGTGGWRLPRQRRRPWPWVVESEI